MSEILFQGGEEFFDSSLSEALDKTIDIKEYTGRITSLLEPILINRFPSILPKQNIKTHKDRINFACPYCGDSMESSYRKRGNIILEGKHKGYYKCFNCGVFKSVINFLEDYKVKLDLDVINYVSNNTGDFVHSNNSKYDVSILMNLDEIEKYAIDRTELKNKFGLIEASDSPIWSWLTKRLQYTKENFLYSPSKNYILILNLTKSGKILGAQKRLFHGLNKYLTFTNSKLNELLGNNKKSDEIDTISTLFGICNLNLNQPITIFEGPLDSFLFRNSIGNAGAQKSFPLDIERRYWFDDDKTGKKKTLKHLEEGNQVFLWERFKRDMGLPYRKKWDLNDVMLWIKGENKNVPLFENYFSNDPLDILDV